MDAIREFVDSFAVKLYDLERELEELRSRVAESPGPKDAFGAIGETFAEELRSLLGDAPPDPNAARRAARLAAAEHAWEQRLGELWDAKEVVSVLGVSKQRVSALAKDHRLITLPQEGRLRFPAWQFAITNGDGRDCLAEAHRLLVEDGDLSPWSAASWFLTEHPDLGGREPLGWVRSGGDLEQLRITAGRDAARAAQ